MKTKNRWYKDPRALRHLVMASFFLFLLSIAWNHQLAGGGPSGEPSVEAYCPFGGFETAYQFILTGGFVRHVEPSSMILAIAVILMTLIISRGFCGWICPFGSVQEWLGLAGKKIFGKRYNPTGAWDRALRYLKYLLLAVILGFTWHLGTLVFREYDPFLAFFHLGKGTDELPWAYAAMGVVLFGSLFIERFFCKYACPLGAALGLIGRFSLTRIERADDGCKGCNLCQKKCHAHVDFLSVSTIKDPECNHCLDCVVYCPKPNVLTVQVRKRFSFSHAAYASVLVATLAGLVFTTKLMGTWQTKPDKLVFTNRLGKLDPAAIRGWMTLEDISKGYSIPKEQLYASTGLPEKVTFNSRLNTIKNSYKLDFEPDRLRDLVGDYLKGKPLTVAASLASLAPASQSAGSKDHKTGEKDKSGKDHKKGGEPEVKGFMTLNEISLKTGVPKEWIIKRLELPANVDARAPLRDWIHDAGSSVPDLREAVKEYKQGRR
jgi:polyferredoxin